jgi:hypothetical protein
MLRLLKANKSYFFNNNYMHINKYVLFIILVCMGISCKQNQDVLYKSETFTLYSDQVVQGDFVAKAVTPTKIISNYKSSINKHKEWILSSNVSAKPSYSSDQKIVDALFNLSLEEALLNIELDSTLRTGAKWAGVWTRDVSYSILLAFAFHEPEVAKISLMKKVNRGRIIQDTGSGGAWPVSSDRTTWALAAWEIYKVTGDEAWLKKSYSIIKNTLEDDYKVLKSGKTGMYWGESSFLDWREQTYPKWMSNADIFQSESLGTNAVHYQAHVICARMAEILGEPADEFLNRAKEIKEGINQYLWMPEKGYYGQYLYGRTFMNLSPRFEALGEALTILFEVANKKQATSVLANSPVTAYGTTCIYPQIPDIPPYHNNGIWPFVQAFWNLAAAKEGNQEVLNHGLASVYRAGAFFLTNYENFVAEDGDYSGTEINSPRQLWSIAGNLATVYHIFMGLSFEEDGIRLNPVIPKSYDGIKKLSNFKYRNANLEITVKGFGNEIASVKMNGETINDAFIPSSITGKNNIEIKMKNNDFGSSGINLVKNKFSLPAPKVTLKDQLLSWENIEGASHYKIFKNGEGVKETNTNFIEVSGDTFSEYSVVAIDSDGVESFSSGPVMIYPKSNESIMELEDYWPESHLPYTNYSGNGFIETAPDKNTSISFPLKIKNAGKYRIDIRYSNGSGPWNTDNNCGIRSLYVNGKYEGVLVFPQRGENEWSNWGFSNSHELSLKQGTHLINIEYKSWNVNMDIETNDIMLDFVRIIRLD